MRGPAIEMPVFFFSIRQKVEIRTSDTYLIIAPLFSKIVLEVYFMERESV
jgi:hypothetical protein